MLKMLFSKVIFKSLKNVQIKNLNRIALARRNINSLRNEFDLAKDQIQENVDVLVMSKTKQNGSFPTGQLKFWVMHHLVD